MSGFWPKEGLLTMMTRDTSVPHPPQPEPDDSLPCSTVGPSLGAPASLSGIISAVLLGLGRVIGETMVVLLCAGNRIAIPDFTAGLGVVTQPVHTMTGIIAQEMGEVVRGSIHYRALFVVGLLLFVISLLINYAAQKIVRRYRISIG